MTTARDFPGLFDADGLLIGYIDSNGREQALLTEAQRVQATNAMPHAKRRIALIGDSILQYGMAIGEYNVTSSPALPDSAIRVSPNLDTPAGGTATLALNMTTLTARWKSDGNGYGAAVDITNGGVYTLTDDAGYTCRIRMLARAYTGSGETEYVLTLGIAENRYATGSPQGILEALYPGRYEWVNLTVGSSGAADVLVRLQQVYDANVDAALLQCGTNDFVRYAAIPTDYVAQMVAIWQALNDHGVPVISGLITPRFTDADATNYTVDLRNNIAYANALLIDAAADRTTGRTAVQIVDTASSAIEETLTTGEARAGWCADGVHPGPPLGLAIARAYGGALERLFPAPSEPLYRSGGASGANSLAPYDATANPRGNLLTGSQCAFVGTGGTGTAGAATAIAAWAASTTAATANVTAILSGGRVYLARSTGTAGTVTPAHKIGVASDGSVLWECISVGSCVTGIAAGWTWARVSGSALVATAWRETAYDNGAPWQCFLITSSADQTLRGTPSGPTVANIDAGDRIVTSVEVDITDWGGGASCGGAFIDSSHGGTPAGTLYRSEQLKDWDATDRGLTGRFRLVTPPLTWLSTFTSMNMKPSINCNAGGIFVARLRSMQMVKIA